MHHYGGNPPQFAPSAGGPKEAQMPEDVRKLAYQGGSIASMPATPDLLDVPKTEPCDGNGDKAIQGSSPYERVIQYSSSNLNDQIASAHHLPQRNGTSVLLNATQSHRMATSTVPPMPPRASTSYSHMSIPTNALDARYSYKADASRRSMSPLPRESMNQAPAARDFRAPSPLHRSMTSSMNSYTSNGAALGFSGGLNHTYQHRPSTQNPHPGHVHSSGQIPNGSNASPLRNRLSTTLPPSENVGKNPGFSPRPDAGYQDRNNCNSYTSYTKGQAEGMPQEVPPVGPPSYHHPTGGGGGGGGGGMVAPTYSTHPPPHNDGTTTPYHRRDESPLLGSRTHRNHPLCCSGHTHRNHSSGQLGQQQPCQYASNTFPNSPRHASTHTSRSVPLQEGAAKNAQQDDNLIHNRSPSTHPHDIISAATRYKHGGHENRPPNNVTIQQSSSGYSEQRHAVLGSMSSHSPLEGPQQQQQQQPQPQYNSLLQIPASPCRVREKSCTEPYTGPSRPSSTSQMNIPGSDVRATAAPYAPGHTNVNGQKQQQQQQQHSMSLNNSMSWNQLDATPISARKEGREGGRGAHGSSPMPSSPSHQFPDIMPSSLSLDDGRSRSRMQQPPFSPRDGQDHAFSPASNRHHENRRDKNNYNNHRVIKYNSQHNECAMKPTNLSSMSLQNAEESPYHHALSSPMADRLSISTPGLGASTYSPFIHGVIGGSPYGGPPTSPGGVSPIYNTSSDNNNAHHFSTNGFPSSDNRNGAPGVMDRRRDEMGQASMNHEAGVVYSASWSQRGRKVESGDSKGRRGGGTGGCGPRKVPETRSISPCPRSQGNGRLEGGLGMDRESRTTKVIQGIDEW